MKLNLRWTVVAILFISLTVFCIVFRNDLFGSDMMEQHKFDIEKYFVAGRYEMYEPQKLALASEKKIVLFFSASWCPSCSLFNEEVSELATVLPDNVLILYVDYDKNFDLRKKHKVAYQHTFVVVDERGEVLHKWSGGGVDRLKQELGLVSVPLTPNP